MLPKFVWVKNARYRVHIDPYEFAFGMIPNQETHPHQLWVSPSMHESVLHVQETFLHELFHAAEIETGVTIGEEAVSKISAAVFMSLWKAGMWNLPADSVYQEILTFEGLTEIKYPLPCNDCRMKDMEIYCLESKLRHPNMWKRNRGSAWWMPSE